MDSPSEDELRPFILRCVGSGIRWPVTQLARDPSRWRTKSQQRRDPLDREELRRIDRHWLAADYLSAGQTHLLDNPLLSRPRRVEHVRSRPLGQVLAIADPRSAPRRAPTAAIDPAASGLGNCSVEAAPRSRPFLDQRLSTEDCRRPSPTVCLTTNSA
ncbi:MAG: hypothetical protein JST59_29105 [Actinobacteria bacterium]|nr:hypothetical protein [Actinomycetota bacterium]